jgi:hypothetical protein
MGGGGDSRIPSILREAFKSDDINVTVRTYDFNPDVAAAEIESWVMELKPSLVIGESLGSIHAIRIKGVPHLLISPSLNGPLYLGYLSWLTFLPGMTWLFDRIYKPREGDRQRLHFTYDTLKRYIGHFKYAMANTTRAGSQDFFHAFFGTRDHYRRSGVVSVHKWKKQFGETYTVYDGTHFTEEDYIYSLVIPKIREVLKN